MTGFLIWIFRKVFSDMKAIVNSVCRKCGAAFTMDAYSSVDVKAEPELKEKILSGELFTQECPVCGEKNLVKYPLMYHDPVEGLLIVLSDASFSVEALPDGYTGRRVRSVGELIEKIKIFDANLDDIVLEMTKYVTKMEMKKDVDLKFLKLDGADNEIIFTYPENDGMQLLSVGFNVYEDCRGIVRRNPSVRASGLAVVDSAWLKEYVG